MVPFTGNRVVPGLRGLAGGPLDKIPEPAPEEIEPAGSLDEDTGEDLPSNGSPR
jgi:urease subunit beta